MNGVATGEGGAFFEAAGDGSYQPTPHVSGAWNEAEQHISPMNGLVVHELERWLAERGDGADRVLSRLSVDILGVLDLDACELSVERVRSGRSVELLEVRVANASRTGVVARAWRIAPADTSAVAGGGGNPLPHPDGCERLAISTTWPGGYIRTLDVRSVAPSRPGRVTAWLRTSTALVAGESSSDLARLVGLVDTANGLALREPPGRALYPNVDLTVHLFRQPRGEWLGLDTTQVFGRHGVGLTSSVLHDVDGPFGRAEQSLFVREQ